MLTSEWIQVLYHGIVFLGINHNVFFNLSGKLAAKCRIIREVLSQKRGEKTLLR
jgi:hypothetical protein